MAGNTFPPFPSFWSPALYSKRLHYSRISISCAPQPFRSIDNQYCGNSSCGNETLKKCRISIFLFFFFSLFWSLLLKAQFNLVPANILKNHGVHPVLLGKWAELPGFSIWHSLRLNTEVMARAWHILGSLVVGIKIVLQIVFLSLCVLLETYKKWRKKCPKSIKLWLCIRYWTDRLTLSYVRLFNQFWEVKLKHLEVR